MPKYWRPLLGPVWIEASKGEKVAEETRETPGERSGKSGGIPESQTEGAAEEPAVGVEPSIGERFAEVASGVFCFKPSGQTATGEQDLGEPGYVPKGITSCAAGALPSSITGYQKIAKTVDGLPVYSFK